MCASQNYKLCIQFTEFSTENGHDNLTVANQSGIIVQSYSGTLIPPKIEANSSLYVNFSSDQSGTEKGFNANFCTGKILNFVFFRLSTMHVFDIFV